MFLYTNFELRNPFISLELIVWSLFAGFIIAALMAIYNKRLIGGFVKQILREECLSPETAKTVTELGYGTDWFIKNALRTDTVLRRFVVRIDKEKPEGEDSETAESPENAGKNKKAPRSPKHDVIDFETAKFYIPEELKYRADVRYASKGTNFFMFGVCVVVFAAAAFAAIYIIPDLIQLIDNFITTMRTEF